MVENGLCRPEQDQQRFEGEPDRDRYSEHQNESVEDTRLIMASSASVTDRTLSCAAKAHVPKPSGAAVAGEELHATPAELQPS